MIEPRKHATWASALTLGLWVGYAPVMAQALGLDQAGGTGQARGTHQANGARQALDPGCFGHIPPADSIPSHRDGSHIFWEADGQGRAIYLVRDAQRGTDEIIAEALTAEQLQLVGAIPVTHAQQARPESLCIVGDLHGEYGDAVKLLRGCGIIDEEDDWAFGRGQLVFCGDVFDRGAGVTDCLWLIRRLERQSAQSGGRAHCLLGNHEHLILNGDLRYVACAPLYLCDALGVAYTDLFGPRTELGRWLRTLPAVIRFGDLLCVHGGISPAVARADLTLDQINNGIRQCLDESACPGDTTAELLFGSLGPLWYRGYFQDAKRY